MGGYFRGRDLWDRIAPENVSPFSREYWGAWEILMEFWGGQLVVDLLGAIGTIFVGGLLALLIVTSFPLIKDAALCLTTCMCCWAKQVNSDEGKGDGKQMNHGDRANAARVMRNAKNTIPAGVSTMGSIAVGGIWSVVFFNVIENYVFEGIRDIITIESIVSISLGLALRPLMTNIIDGLLLVSTGKLHQGDHLFIAGGSRYVGKVISFDLGGALLEMEDVQGYSRQIIHGLADRRRHEKKQKKTACTESETCQHFILPQERIQVPPFLTKPFLVGKIPYSDVQNGMFYVISEELMEEYIKDATASYEFVVAKEKAEGNKNDSERQPREEGEEPRETPAPNENVEKKADDDIRGRLLDNFIALLSELERNREQNKKN